MKLFALGMLVMVSLVALDGAVPGVDVVGEAAAVECDTVDLGDVQVNACDAVCAVGDRLGWACIE